MHPEHIDKNSGRCGVVHPEMELTFLRRERDELMASEDGEMEDLRFESNINLEVFCRGEKLEVLNYITSDDLDDDGEILMCSPSEWVRFYETCDKIQKLERKIYDSLPKFHF
jgi:hypothetical protein